MALTGPLALNAGTYDARSSSGTGNGMLTSNGASPWMRIRHPVGCRPQSGSTSMATKPYWMKRTRSTPPLRPVITIRCAAAVPALISPATIVMSSLGRGHAALGGPLVDLEAGDVRQHGQRRLVLAEQVVLAPLGIELRQRLPEAHLLHHHVRRRAAGEVAELLDLDQVDAPLHRQQGQREGLGDEPRIAAARPHRRAAPPRTPPARGRGWRRSGAPRRRTGRCTW